jgi:hypothetical protein
MHFFYYFYEMVIGLEFHDIINNVFGSDVKGIGQSEQLQTCCPKCQEREGLSHPDGKYNLEINTSKRVFRCWKCDEPKFSGSLGRLIKIYGSHTDYEVYKSYAKIFRDYTEEEDFEDVFVKLPSETIFIEDMDVKNPNHFKFYNYLVNDRKISRDIILKYKLGFCEEGKYYDRIIVPSFDIKGEINYFVARAIDDKMKPKYMNPDVNKGLFIFNEGFVNWDSTVYLCEGAFEMLSFPINTIPILGKDILGELFSKLKKHKPNIVILLDPDAYKTTINIYFQLHSIYGNETDKIRIIKLPSNDDLDEIRKKLGNDGMINAIYGARKLMVDDYFIKKLNNFYGRNGNNGQYSYSKYFKG